MKVKWVIHRSREKIRTKDHGFAVSKGYATDSDAKTHCSCRLQDAQINRTQFVARTGGAYPTVSLASTNPVGIGRMRTGRLNEKLDSTQSRLISRAPS